MNRNKLKTYAPAARRDFLQAVKDRAVVYGLSAKKIEPMTERGDVVLIAGQPFPKSVAVKRKRLEERIASVGFERAMEAIAYCWFNRFVAIRFMELHGYLDHGYRVLSHPTGDIQPEILEHAQRVDFPGLDKSKVVELKLDGTKQEELYRLLLVAQCNALSQAMPFLFERIDDETELLLPSNLLATDSLIQKLVKEIDEEDWKEVEILGWLYQFYISERKDEVIGKVVASEDIPAATQLFTPNWIVKYLVQNTLGRIWLATYPQSGIRQQMEFYIEPAEQTPEVQEQLKAITPTSLNPEDLTLLDPACGSAHILVEAYDLFKAIYQERGYRAKDIPGLILSKNLYGLEIDDRAAQLAAFALLMKARADDRRILESGIQPAILSFIESKGMDAEAITHALNSPINGGAEGTVAKADITALLELFEEAKTFGSLIQIPAGLAEKLPAIEERLAAVLKDGDLTHAQAGVIAPLLRQARLLARKYDTVVANPPYMGNGYFTPALRRFINSFYKPGKEDLYACFVLANVALVKANGFVGMITIPNWMFLSYYEGLRETLLESQVVDSLVHNGRGVWGSDFGSCSFILRRTRLPHYAGVFRRLFDTKGSVSTNEELQRRFSLGGGFFVQQSVFTSIPGTPLAYWVSEQVLRHFRSGHSLSDFGEARRGLQTGDGPRFVRLWHEVDASCTALNTMDRTSVSSSGARWVLFNNGGDFRKWYGNVEHVVLWANNGADIKATAKAIVPNEHHYFNEAISWSRVSAGKTAFRLVRGGILPGDSGPCVFTQAPKDILIGVLNTSTIRVFLEILVPTLTFLTGDIERLPIAPDFDDTRWREVGAKAKQCVSLAQQDWDSQEASWGFGRYPLLNYAEESSTLRESWERHHQSQQRALAEMARLERDLNELVAVLYELTAHITAEVAPADITLHCSESGIECRNLLSYAIGCMMGRYSLDNEGLIYAHSGNQGFDPSHYTKFPADDDGIIPVTEAPWFDDDAANRFERFVKTAWPAETLDENLAFVAESLGAKKSETPRETVRRYFAGDFYKHHLQTYKNRPIYWLFSSGKQGAFEALVYLHRYNEGTLSRMRTEYVVPLLGKMNGRLGMLADVIAKATSTKQRKDAEKEKDKLAKQLAELQAFDDKLRHYADQRITLDLDDGVRVNYGKFGDLLADVKKVCGKAEEE